MARSITVREVLCQSPVTEAPSTRPAAVIEPGARMPAAESRSIVTVSDADAIQSKTSQVNRRVAFERSAQNTTTSGPGPFPTFAPAKQKVLASNCPATTQAAAGLRRSITSSRILIPSIPKAHSEAAIQAAPNTKYPRTHKGSERTLAAEYFKSTTSRETPQIRGRLARENRTERSTGTNLEDKRRENQPRQLTKK